MMFTGIYASHNIKIQPKCYVQRCMAQLIYSNVLLLRRTLRSKALQCNIKLLLHLVDICPSLSKKRHKRKEIKRYNGSSRQIMA